jgi:hypothetical protein
MADHHHREEDATLWQCNTGITRVEGVPRDMQFFPHLSRSGSRGYDIPFREMILENHCWYSVLHITGGSTKEVQQVVQPVDGGCDHVHPPFRLPAIQWIKQ